MSISSEIKRLITAAHALDAPLNSLDRFWVAAAMLEIQKEMPVAPRRTDLVNADLIVLAQASQAAWAIVVQDLLPDVIAGPIRDDIYDDGRMLFNAISAGLEVVSRTTSRLQ